MNKIEIFETAMCCESGLCGVNINPELIRIATTINNLKKKGANISRYNLSNAPKMFIMNETINKHINEYGTKSLPIILLNGEIIKKGEYPTNEELEKWCKLKIDNNDNPSICC